MPFPIAAAATRIAAAAVVTASVFAAGAAMAQQPSPAQEREAMQACRADYETLCKGVEPGGGRIIACLMQHAEKVSPGCKQALMSLKPK